MTMEPWNSGNDDKAPVATDINGVCIRALIEEIATSPFLPFIKPSLIRGDWTVTSKDTSIATVPQLNSVDTRAGWLLNKIDSYVREVARGLVLLEDDIVHLTDVCMSRPDRPRVWVYRERVFWPIMHSSDSDIHFDSTDIYWWRGGFRTLSFFTEAFCDFFPQGDYQLTDAEFAFCGKGIRRVVVDNPNESIFEAELR